MARRLHDAAGPDAGPLTSDHLRVEQAQHEVALLKAQQEALAMLVGGGLNGRDLQSLLDQACRSVASVLKVPYSAVLELSPDGTELSLRAGTGWRTGPSGEARVPAPAGLERAPCNRVDVEYYEAEGRCSFLEDHGVRSAATVVIGGPARPFGVLGVYDRHGRHHTEAELDFLRVLADIIASLVQHHRSQDELRLLIEGVKDYAVYVIDLDGLVTTWNPGAERITGYRADEIVGQHFSRFYPPGDVAAGKPERDLRTVATEGRYTEEAWRIRKDGTSFLADIVLTPVHDAQGQLRGFSKVTRDVTERLKLQQQVAQSQRLEAVGELAGGVAHDFNNILTVILGYVDILLEEIDAASPIRDDVEGISRATQRAGALVHQLLAFSRRQMLQPAVFDLNDAALSLQSMLRRLIPDDITLAVVTPDDPVWTMADRHQVDQVVMNLVINARDAMPDGGVISIETSTVDVAVEGGAGTRRFAMLQVTDTGNGMDIETLAHCFEPFFTTKDAGRGTGLGLSTVYGIVRQSGGRVLVESSPAMGTTFRVELPLAERKGDVGADPAAEPCARGAGTVLLVEDEEEVRRLAFRALERAGYRVLEAVDGVDALAVAEAEGAPVDLLITDVAMPRLGGTKLAEQLRRDGRVGDVLFISGYLDHMATAASGPAVGDRLLVKPFRSEVLLQRVRQLLHV